MKIIRLTLVIFVLGMSLQAALPDRVEWESFLSAESIERQGIITRANDLQLRIDNLAKNSAQLHRDMDRTRARIDCASKVMQVLAVVVVQFLGIVAIDYVFKKPGKKKKIKEKIVHAESKKKSALERAQGENYESEHKRVTEQNNLFFCSAWPN